MDASDHQKYRTPALYLKDRKEFYSKIGDCINSWAVIENLIFEVFCNALHTEVQMCRSIFWSIPTFTMRLSYTSNLVLIALSKNDNPSKQHKNTLAKEWVVLNACIKDKYKIRNHIAHQPRSEDIFREISNDTLGKISLKVDITKEFVIIPNKNDPNQNFSPIDTQTLTDHIEHVTRIEFELQRFIPLFFEARALKYPHKPNIENNNLENTQDN